MVFKNYQTEEVSPKSTISQFDSGNSPTVKLTKYRWVKHAKPRKSSLDLKPASQFGKGPVASPSRIESDSESEEIHTSSRRIAQLNKEMGVLHVDKNLKYVHKLKRNPILKDTLLGKILNLKKNDMADIKYVEQDQLFSNRPRAFKLKEVTKMISDGYKSSSGDSWSYIEDTSHAKNLLEMEKKLPSNPNIYFKPLDTFAGERKPKNLKETRKSGDHHLLLPFTQEEYKRMDSGASSNECLKTVKVPPVSGLINKESIERRHTPGANLETKLVTKGEGLKLPSIRFEEVPDKFPKAITPQANEGLFNRKVALNFKKKPRNKAKGELTLKEQLLEKEIYYEEMIVELVTSGEGEKLIDLLSKININLEFKDIDGNTPLNIAAQNGYVEIVNILLRNGAYIDTQNNFGNTALHYAYTYNFPRVLNLLISNGADQTVLNEKGHIPWEGI